MICQLLINYGWSASIFWMCIEALKFFHLFAFMVVLQHLLSSVTEPQYRTKPAGVSDVSSIWLKFSLQCRPPGLYCFFLAESIM